MAVMRVSEQAALLDEKKVDEKVEMWELSMVEVSVAVMVGRTASRLAALTGAHSEFHWGPPMVCCWVALMALRWVY